MKNTVLLISIPIAVIICSVIGLLITKNTTNRLIKEENNVPGTKIEEIGKHDEQIKYLHKELISLQVKYQQQVKRQEKMERVVLDVVKALQSISEENQ